jgi:hypothetical protein
MKHTESIAGTGELDVGTKPAFIDAREFRLLLNLVAALILVLIVNGTVRNKLTFDDSYMFERYAFHLRQGLGISWNPDGVHTAGMTSLGWFFVVLPLSFLPLWGGRVLALASVATGIAGFAMAAWIVCRLSKFRRFNRYWFVFPVTVILLAGSESFRQNMSTGIDTMLSFLVNVLLCGAIWAWVSSSEGQRAWNLVVGFLGASTVIVRPENGLLAFIAPLLAMLLLLDAKRRHEYLGAVSTFALILTAYVFLYQRYFHVFAPLSFYMKSVHPYQGYIGAWKWNPKVFAAKFLLMALPIIAFPIVISSRRSMRVAGVFFVPVTMTCIYLGSVVQIMGVGARYYVPFIAPVLISAFWMADIALREDWRQNGSGKWRLYCGAALICIIGVLWHPLMKVLSSTKQVRAYQMPDLTVSAVHPLPQTEWFRTIEEVAHGIVDRLPRGSSIAASEVGLIGASAPQISVIDLSGLNDTEIATHGFSAEAVLNRKPTVIWFPHSDYTWQRHLMFCSPRLLDEYELFGGNAFNYSLAVRRDSPAFVSIEGDVKAAFGRLYPQEKVANYIVTRIDGSGVCAGA